MENNTGSFRATAVVASFNEGPRIARVLEALLRAKLVSEIIVVDDGSKDDTGALIKNSFPSVRYLLNEQNRGKAFSMDRGVREASNDIIFFCDADLVGLTPEMIDEIISPITRGEHDMFIGIRSNLMQRSVLPFALNSGERAMRKQIWQRLPDFYKHRFRIEAGLNFMVRFTSEKGMGYKVLPYSQTLKEKKYGFWQGEWQRWRMNLDVVVGWVRAFWDFYLLGYIFKRPARTIQ